MLRLYDARAGQPEPVTGARRGELRMLIRGPGTGRRPRLGDLRSYLLPDLIRRWAERRGLQVFTLETVGTADDATLDALRADRAALNIHPPDRTSGHLEPGGLPGVPTAAASPGGGAPAFDIATGDGGGSQEMAGLAGHHAVSTGLVTFEGRGIAALAAGLDDAEGDLAGCAEGGLAGEASGRAQDADGIVWLSDVTGLGLDPLALRLAFLRHRYRDQAD